MLFMSYIDIIMVMKDCFLITGNMSLKHVLFCKTDFSFASRKIVISYNNNIIIII